MPDDKRTQIGPTGPVRPMASRSNAAATPAAATPAAATPAAATPAPITGQPGGSSPSGASYLPAQGDPLLGQVLAGRYLIQKKLGEGGMGAVYLAAHTVLEKQVALKILHGELARKPDLVERFMQEAKAASRIRHENVIDISDFGTTPEGLVFFAMELLEGHDLHEEIARARLAGLLLPWERSKRIFLQICAALGAAHGLGIIHRDLKPENIYLVEFLGEPDFVKLLDFGIAKLTEVEGGDRKLTRTGMLFGTPEYMSPEQARGESVDHRVDIYAMGCILFQLVTGKVPFEAENFMGVLTLHLTEPPPVIPPEVLDSIGAPRALAAVIDQALAKDRDQRFATVDDLARAVRRASGDWTGPVAAPANVPAPPGTAAIGRVKTQWTGNLSVPEREAPPPAKSKLPLVVGAVVLAGGVAVAAAALVMRGGSPPGGGRAGGSEAITAAIPPGPPPPPGARPPPGPPPPPAAPASSGTIPGGGESALPFERTQIRLGSTPSGAEVRDLASGRVIGKTPFSFTLPSSHTPRQFSLHRNGYVDAVLEIVPDREKIEHVERLDRGAGTRPAVVRHAVPPTAGPPATVPGPPRPTGPDTVPPAPRDDDTILLKPDPSRSGSGSGTP